MGKEFVCTGFHCTMVEDHCVKAAKGEKFRSQNAAKCNGNDLLMAPK